MTFTCAIYRLILSMDPRHGELSRAMRNRGVEMSLAEDTSPKGNGDMDTGVCPWQGDCSRW